MAVAGTGVAGEYLAQATLPASALAISSREERVYVSAGWSGTGFLSLKESGTLSLDTFSPELPSWHVLPVGNGWLLLASAQNPESPSGYLAIVNERDPGRPCRTCMWEVDGLPLWLALKGDLLAVSSGGAGVALYDWKGPMERPELRGRFPFVDFTKRCVFLASGDLAVADNFDGGLLTIDTADPLRPALGARAIFGDFADSVAADSRFVMVTGRRDGFYLFDIATPGAEPRLCETISVPFAQDRRARWAESTGNVGEFLLSEGIDGVRIVRVERGATGAVKTTTTDRLAVPGRSFGQSHRTESGYLLVAGDDRTLTVWKRVLQQENPSVAPDTQ